MSNTEKSKFHKCKYCHHLISSNLNEGHCVVDGWEDDKVKVVTKEDCDNCQKYESKYIEYPITVNRIENEKIEPFSLGHEIGSLCEIRPCGEEYNGKSYVGFYLGELPISIHTSLSKDGTLTNRTMNNPAIFVPELKKIIYGCESWWREINSIEDFKGISKEEIDNTWYVKLIKEVINE